MNLNNLPSDYYLSLCPIVASCHYWFVFPVWLGFLMQFLLLANNLLCIITSRKSVVTAISVVMHTMSFAKREQKPRDIIRLLPFVDSILSIPLSNSYVSIAQGYNSEMIYWWNSSTHYLWCCQEDFEAEAQCTPKENKERDFPKLIVK